MSQMRLLKERKFYPLFWTQFFGAFNDNFLKNAMVILITFKVDQILGIPSSQIVAVAGGIFILPFFLFSATAGQLADKYEKSKIIRIIKIIEIGIMILASVGFISEHYGLLLIVLFLIGLHSTFFGPIKYSILPEHLSNDELVGGNALIEAGTFLSILIGTIAGGVLIAVPDHGAWYVSIGLVVVAILGYLFSRQVPPTRSLNPSMKVQWNPITPTLEIYRFTKKNKTVYLSVLGISWFWFFGAAMLSLFPAYCKDVLKTDQSVVTLFLAVFSIGIGAGSLFCEKLSRRGLELGLVPFGSMGISLFTFLLFISGSPNDLPEGLNASGFLQVPSGLIIILELLFLSVFSGFFIVPLYTLILERSESTHRSRIIAGNNILNAFFMVVASASLVIMMAVHLTIPQIFLVLAILNSAASLYIYTVLPEFLYRFILWMLANVMYRIKVVGDQNIPQQGPALLICNHVSFVDWMFIASVSPRPPRFVMDHLFAKGWLMSRLSRRMKIIPIATAKENPETMNAAFVKVAQELRAGELVCVFPEGKITFDGNLSVFKPGIERILAETPVPIVPMVLGGMWGSFFSRKGGGAIKKLPRRFWSRVTLDIGQPIPPAEQTAQSLQIVIETMIKSRNFGT